MTKVEGGSSFGGEEDFDPYVGSTGIPYHGKFDHMARSVAHQPNHLRFLNRSGGTNRLDLKDVRRLMRRLMRRVRRP